jgi:hypothetical protein
MPADVRCLGCGSAISIDVDGAPPGVIARGDRFMHEGCVLDSAAVSKQRELGVPPYLLRGGRRDES